MSTQEIVEAYDLRHSTVKYCKWALRYPDAFVRHRAFMREWSRRRMTDLRADGGERRPHHMAWSVEHETRLRELWASHHSFSEIGRELGRSRNSVAGKINRMRREEDVNYAG